MGRSSGRYKIITPGHGVYPDSLIMYAILRGALEADVLEQVIGFGGSYTIVIQDLMELAREISNVTVSYHDYIMEAVGPFIQVAERKKIERALHELANRGACYSYLTSLLSPGHSVNEGRIGKRLPTAPLALLPHAGKYLTSDFSSVSRAYAVCEHCLAFLTLGFFAGSIRPISPPDFLSIVITFEGLVSEERARMLVGQLEEFRKKALQGRMPSIPLRVAVWHLVNLFMRDTIRAMSGAEASWQAIGFRFQKPRGVLQIRGTIGLHLDPLLDCLSKLPGDVYDRLQKLAGKLLDHESLSALEYLYTFLNSRNLDELSKATREIYTVDRGLLTFVEKTVATLVRSE